MEYLLLLLFVPFLFGDLFHDDDGGAPDINGTPEDDVLQGTGQAEDINAGGGDDLVSGGGGDDDLDLGVGNDVALGEGGDDLILGGGGDDLVDGGAGNDTIWLGKGDDVIDVGFLDEVGATDPAGDDRMSGGDGDDSIADWVGSDTLTGELGQDLIVSVDEMGTEDAGDVTSGGWGLDTLVADDGDTVSGGGSADEFHVYADEVSDAAVTVTDFDGAREQLILDLDVGAFGDLTDEDFTTETDPDTGDVSVLLDGQVVALLTNPAQFDPATNIEVRWWEASAA